MDLVFPRNETYRPGSIPILFAVRNSPLAVPLTMHIGWTLWESSGNKTKTASGDRELLCDELGQTDPFFTAEHANPAKTTDSEATWVLPWNVQSQNCTVAQNHSWISQLLQSQQVTFTTKKGAQEPESDIGVGDDIGEVKLSNGSTVSAGRLLMRDQWNSALHEPLQQEFDKSQTTALPDVRFHKSRLSGFWGGTTRCMEYLKAKGITTLLFAGVNTDQCVLACLQDACNMGFDIILLKDGCGTTSPEYATEMVELNCRKSWGFVSSCQGLENGVKNMETLQEAGHVCQLKEVNWWRNV